MINVICEVKNVKDENKVEVTVKSHPKKTGLVILAIGNNPPVEVYASELMNAVDNCVSNNIGSRRPRRIYYPDGRRGYEPDEEE